MESMPDEEARIKKSSSVMEGHDQTEKSVMNKSTIRNNTLIDSKSNFDQTKISSLSATQNLAKSRYRFSTDLGIKKKIPGNLT